MTALLQDFRYAFRTLGRSPGFTVVAVVTLALGIGANTAIFSVVNSVLLSPLPYRDSDRLVWIHDGLTSGDKNGWSACIADFLLWQSRSRSFERLAAFSQDRFTVGGDGEPEQLVGAEVTAAFFETLGVQPMLGRTFAADADQPGRPKTVLLSEGLWRRRFGGDPNTVGKTISLDGQPAVVIGVMPASFRFRLRDADVWSSLTLNPPTRRGPFYIRGVARLKPGVTLEHARADLDGLAREVERDDPKRLKRLRYPVFPLRDAIVDDVRPLLLMLTGTVGLVLLIAVFNVANLMLARATSREREMAIRLGMGAGPGRLVRQLLTESGLLALTGGAAGTLLALAGVNALRALAPAGLPRIDEIAVDHRVLLFTLLVSVGSGLVFGLAPALAAVRTNLNDALKQGARGGTEARARGLLREGFVIAEIAISIVLLAGAGLLVRSFALLGRVAPGFTAPPERVMTMQLSPAGDSYDQPARLSAFWDDLVRLVREIPGVESAALTGTVPPDRLAFADSFEIPGKTPPDGGPVVPVPLVSADYFRTLGIPLVQGRPFDGRDTLASPRVSIISQTLARRYFAGENPLGQRLKHGGPHSANPYTEIIGVVADVKYEGLARENLPVYYETVSQLPDRPMWLVVRSRGNPQSLALAVRARVRRLDPDVPVSRVSSMAEALDDSMSAPRFRAFLMGGFASSALLLAAVGIYGVIAFSVAQRTREIGIRIALGAASPNVVWLVVGHGSRLALIGATIGLAASGLALRALKTMLFGVTPADFPALASAALVLALSALLASYLPARRATRVDPIIALRSE